MTDTRTETPIHPLISEMRPAFIVREPFPDEALYKTEDENLINKNNVGEIYNLWYKSQLVRTKREYWSQSRDYRTSNIMAVKDLNEAASPILDKIYALPDEVLGLLLTEGKKPEDLTREEINTIISVIEQYEKDDGWYVEINQNNGITEYKVSGSIIWQGSNLNSIKPRGVMPELLLKNARLNPKWKVLNESGYSKGQEIKGVPTAIFTKPTP